jgi:mannose-6-phosphate isomerase-like protein (cupin superfamily)
MSSTSSKAGKEEQHSGFEVSSRKVVASGSDVQVKEFTLAAGEQVPWHRHSEMFDVFYCLEGHLNIERADARTGIPLPELVLKVGESAKVEPGTAHRPFNPGPGPCRFVLVQGVGKYDYIPFEPKA